MKLKHSGIFCDSLRPHHPETSLTVQSLLPETLPFPAKTPYPILLSPKFAWLGNNIQTQCGMGAKCRTRKMHYTVEEGQELASA